MNFNQNAYGYFGMPEQLGVAYGTDQQSQGFDPTAGYDNLPSAEPTPFIRNGKPLPYIKGGATDGQVHDATGILGLISEIQRRMNSVRQSKGNINLREVTGIITDDEIKSFQFLVSVTQDGIIGPQTYKALGLEGPYQSASRSSSSSSSSSSAPTKAEKDAVAIGGEPFYKKKWFLYSVTGASLIGAYYFLFHSKE